MQFIRLEKNNLFFARCVSLWRHFLVLFEFCGNLCVKFMVLFFFFWLSGAEWKWILLSRFLIYFFLLFRKWLFHFMININRFSMFSYSIYFSQPLDCCVKFFLCKWKNVFLEHHYTKSSFFKFFEFTIYG